MILNRSGKWYWSHRLMSKYEKTAYISCIWNIRSMWMLPIYICVESLRIYTAITNICVLVQHGFGFFHKVFMQSAFKWSTVSSQLCLTPGYCFPAARMGRFSGWTPTHFGPTLLTALGADILLCLITKHKPGPQAVMWTPLTNSKSWTSGKI